MGKTIFIPKMLMWKTHHFPFYIKIFTGIPLRAKEYHAVKVQENYVTA